MNDNYKLFKQIIKESNYDNTYKMAWAKSLVELSTQIDLTEEYIKISFSDIAEKYIKYYWDQTIFFNLEQGSNLTKPPVILTYVKELIQKYFKLTNSNIPEQYEKAKIKFDKVNLANDYNKLVQKIISELKKDVSWRFKILDGKDTEIYSYIKGNDFIIINSSLLKQLKENEQDLYDLINYRWGLILETFNSSPRINKKVKIMDEKEIKNNPLNKFKKILDLGNRESLNVEQYSYNKEKIRKTEDWIKNSKEKIAQTEEYINENNYYDKVNKKRVENKKLWLQVLENENQTDNMALDILFYLYDCKNYTSNGKTIANYFQKDVAAINSYISSFGKRIIDLLKLEEQVGNSSKSRRWNIPFETVPELNKNNIFTWKLREELIEALVEKYDLIPREEENIEDKIKQYIDDVPYEKFTNNIKNDLDAREYFVTKFNINNIMQMNLDDFVIGRADFDAKGKDTFCYLIERTMINLGDMRGSYVSKFGVWYSKKNDKYDYSKKYGNTLESAFENLKKEICLLLVSANNDDYEKINQCEIANIFKGKILSTYFPDKYLCIFDEEDVDKFLNILNIKYDVHITDTLEKKKSLLKEYKNNNKYFKDKTDYYFVGFLYSTFRNELKIKNTISGEIDYNLEFVDFEYLKKHIIEKRNGYRSRETDYEKINRNKKDIGNRGERAVLQSEINKLNDLGLSYLAKQVCICDNDAIGYDITSYDGNGNEIHIEVKTNSSNKSYLDFYITDNELQHLKDEDNYYIYYLYNIKGKPKCHIINKDSILKNETEFFQPVIYKVNIDIQQK